MNIPGAIILHRESFEKPRPQFLGDPPRIGLRVDTFKIEMMAREVGKLLRR